MRLMTDYFEMGLLPESTYVSVVNPPHTHSHTKQHYRAGRRSGVTYVLFLRVQIHYNSLKENFKVIYNFRQLFGVTHYLALTFLTLARQSIIMYRGHSWSVFVNIRKSYEYRFPHSRL